MARGDRNITRSERKRVELPAEYEYSVTLEEFYDLFGIPYNEEPRAMAWKDGRMFITTRIRPTN